MSTKKRILVAEDDLATSQAWNELITAWGYRVEVAEDGKGALELVDSYEPHILLLDLRLPQKDGIQVLSELREKGLQIPTVMISGEGEVPAAVQAIKLGGHDYSRQPVDPSPLRFLLNNLSPHLTVSEVNQRLRRRHINAGRLVPM